MNRTSRGITRKTSIRGSLVGVHGRYYNMFFNIRKHTNVRDNMRVIIGYAITDNTLTLSEFGIVLKEALKRIKQYEQSR